MNKETATILDDLRKQSGYVKRHDPDCFFEDTIKLAMGCESTIKDGVKFFKKKVKIFAGPFNDNELWMLHNVLIDLKEKKHWFLVRETDSEQNFINSWNILIALDDKRTK